MIRILLVLLTVITIIPNIANAACPEAPVGSNQDRVVQMVVGADGVTQMAREEVTDATEEGAIVYDATNNTIAVCDGTDWVVLGGGGGSGPSGCVLEGHICDDGTILAGVTNNQVFYAAPADESGTFAWATVNQNNPGARSSDDGQAIHTDIFANRTLSQYPAFEACEDLNNTNYLGRTGWYLPSLNELNALYRNKGTIGGFGTGWYWSSSEDGSSLSRPQRFSDGARPNFSKSNTYAVRCVRR